MCRVGGVLAISVVLAACQLGQGGRQQTLQRSMVVADEPQAAIVGREALDAGGNAVDAAVAAGLMLGATLPSRAGLGGGGVCLVHEPSRDSRETGEVEGRVRALYFAPASVGAGVAVPGIPRGLYALHADFGRLRWAELVRPAEMAARFGQPVSRALAADLATAGGRAAAAALPALAGADGERLAEGARLVQPALADTLASLRTDGPAGFYQGRLARRIAEGSETVEGGGLSREVLSDYAPQWRDLTPIEIGNDALYFAPGSTAGGDILSRIWPLLEDGGYGRAEAAERPVRLVAAWREVAGGMAGRRVPPGATVATVDSLGRAVVCSFSLGRLFGSGVPVGDTGLFLAPSAPGVDQLVGGLAIAVNHPTDSPLFVGGGTGALSAAATPVAEALLAGADAGSAVRAPRAEPVPGSPGSVVEARAPAGTAEALAALGGPVTTVEGLGLASGVICVRPENRGPRDQTVTCTAVADPRGAGLARGEEFVY